MLFRSASLATLELIEEGLMQNATEVGEYVRDALEEIQVRHPTIGEVRGKGLMIGIEFVDHKNGNEPNKIIRDRIEELAFQHGLLIMGCGISTVRMAPPLTLSTAEADEGLFVFEEAVTMAERETY